MKKGQFLLCTKDLYMEGTTESPVFCNNEKYLILEVKIEDFRVILLDETHENHTITDEVYSNAGWLQYFKEVES